MDRDSSFDHSVGTIDDQERSTPLSPAVGDALEDFLTSYGITKEWYVEFKEKHGLPPTCNCDARQEWLNKTAAAHPVISDIGTKLLAAITRR